MTEPTPETAALEQADTAEIQPDAAEESAEAGVPLADDAV